MKSAFSAALKLNTATVDSARSHRTQLFVQLLWLGVVLVVLNHLLP